MASSPGKFSARAAVLARGAGTFTGAGAVPRGGCHRAAAWSASCSSGQSPISDVPASYGQPVPMCKPSRPLTGTWSTLCVCPPPCLPSPLTGDGLTCLLSSRFHDPGAYITTGSTSGNVQPFYLPLRRVMWTTSVLPLRTGCEWFLPGDSPAVGAGRCGNPQNFPLAHRLAVFVHKSSTGLCTEW